MNYTIPLTTPPGKYLLRAEHLFNDYSGVNNTQFYHSCAHIDVVGPGGGVPGPTIRLPEGYVDDPGKFHLFITLNLSLGWGIGIDAGMREKN